MKKKLAKVIMMGLLCTSVLPSVGEASIYTVNNSCDFSESAIFNSNDNSISEQVGLKITDANNDVVINFVDTGSNDIVWLAVTNSADLINENMISDVVLKGDELYLLDGSDDGVAIHNKGKNLIIDNKVRISMDGHDNQYGRGTGILNEGTMNVNNRLYIITTNQENDNNASIVNKSNAILNINGALYIDNSVRRGIVNYPEGVAIENYGILNIKQDPSTINDISNSYEIYGDIITRAGGITNIELGDAGIESNNSVVSNIFGVIEVEDNAKLNFKLSKGAIWYVSNRQEHVIDGLELSDGFVWLGGERELYNGIQTGDASIDMFDKEKYCTLSLSNLKCSATVSNFGGFQVHTDLVNNTGDKIRILSLNEVNPNVVLPVYIQDKIIDNWWNENTGQYECNPNDLISPNDGHKVTIVTSPVDSGLNVNGMATYTEGNKVYEAVIKEEVVDGWNNWNFVGWEAGVDERPKDKAKQEQVDHSILVEDVEPIFKRFNDLRTDPSEIGVWVRGETGETKIRNLSYDHNIMSGGYDWDYKNDAGVLFAGVGFTYSTNECDDKAIGDTKGYGFNVYGSWLGKKNNDYVDLVVKYGKLDKSYAGYDENNIFVAGDYDKDLFTIAAKYGRRIFRDGWYYEPSVGLTWGRVGSADFTDNYGTRIHADNSYSNIASLGIQVGKNIKGIEYYGKAEVMHDFDGKIHVSAPGRSVEDDMGGTWVKCAIGASRKIDENNSFYLEVERDFGNKVEKPYGFSAGYRFTW